MRAEGTDRTGAWFPRLPGRPLQQIAPGLYRVRTLGGRSFFAVDREGVTIIDVGAPGSGQILLTALEELGYCPDDVRQVLVTHSHIDHAGALPEVRALIAAPVAMHAADAAEVGPWPPPNPFVHDGLAKVMEPVMRILTPGGIEVDMELEDGDRLDLFGGMRVVHCPGHTPGSAVYLFEERGIAVVGDAAQHRFGQLMAPSKVFTRDMPAAMESLARLAGFDFEMLVFSHFRPLRAAANIRLQEYLRSDAAARVA